MHIKDLLIIVLILLLPGCKHNSKTNSEGRRLTPTSQPIRLSSEQTDASEPAIASSSDGMVYIAWVNHEQNGKADVMVARLTDDGDMRGAPVRVNPRQGIATAWRGDPPTIKIGPDKTIYVSWTAKMESQSGHATDLYVSASRDLGLTFADHVKVNDDKKPAVHGMHSLTVDKDGRIYLAWLDERNVSPVPAMDMKMSHATSGHHMESNREVFIASSSDGGRTFSTNKRLASDVCPCCKTAMAIAPDGRLYLSWRQVLPGDFRHIAIASSTDRGQTFTKPVIVSDDQWMLKGCPVSGPSMTVTGDGVLHVLWYSSGKNGETGVYTSESTDSGNSFERRTLVAKGETRGTPVLMNDGRILTAVWESASGKIMTAPLGSHAQGQPDMIMIAEGELPAAVETPKSCITAYIAKDQQRQAVWIVTSTNATPP